MAAVAALNVVKQIQALADGPETAEMKGCLPQVVSSLQFFLEHPDSRVRLTAARTLLKLKRSYPDDVAKQDFDKIRACRVRCVEAIENSTADADAQEFRELLDDILGEAPKKPSNSTSTSSAAAAAATEPPTRSVRAEQGEVVLKVNGDTDGKVKAVILEKVVKIAGVVSVTFEGCFVVVNTRSADLAADAGFLADLLSAIKAQGIQGVTLVNTGAPSGVAMAAMASHNAADATPPTASASSSAPAPTYPDEAGDDDYGADPGYLDDDEDDVVVSSGPPPGAGGAGVGVGIGAGFAGGGYPGGGMPGAAFGGMPGAGMGGAGRGLGGVPPNWSFFSQSHWMAGRRMQQFDDDPSIGARLAKAKQREKEKREEEKSKLSSLTGRLSSLWGGGS